MMNVIAKAIHAIRKMVNAISCKDDINKTTKANNVTAL